MRQLLLPLSRDIVDLALSPDGLTLAVAHRNHGVALYDPFDGRVKFEQRGYFSQLTFRPDGQWLLATNPSVCLVAMDRLSQPAKFLQNSRIVFHADFRGDDQLRELSYIARVLQLPGEAVYADAQAAPVAVAEHPLGSAPDARTAFAWGLGPGDTALVVEFEGMARPLALDYAARRPLALVDSPEVAVRNWEAARFRPYGDWFALTTNRELAIYNWSDLATLVPPPQEQRRRGLFQALRETLIGPSSATIYERRYGSLPTLRPRFRVPPDRPSADPLPVAFLPNGRGFLCRGANAAIELRDLTTGQVQQSWQFQRAWPRVLAVAPDGLTAMAAVKGGGVTFWDLE